jgi:S-adenosylmethionine hydrolase
LSLVTLTTDFGSNSIYIGTSKAFLKRHLPEVDIIDITHSIEPCDISEAAYVLQLAMGDFPAGTVHLVAVDMQNRSNHPEVIVAELNDQYFVSYNSGLLGMLDTLNEAKFKVYGNYSERHFSVVKGAFGPVAQLILSGEFNDLESLPENMMNKKNMQLPVISENHLSGNVMYFDERGIAYTNIHQDDYDKFTGGKNAIIRLTRFETIDTIRKHLADEDPGTAGGFFNDNGYLCVGIYHDDTRTMLGFKKGHVIIVENL